MAVLCTGSVAIDHIMVFRGRFKDVILPDKIHVLNVAFHVPKLRRSWGGTAANIAFNLKLLGEEPVVVATVGADFETYARWLDAHQGDARALVSAAFANDLDRGSFNLMSRQSHRAQFFQGADTFVLPARTNSFVVDTRSGPIAAGPNDTIASVARTRSSKSSTPKRLMISAIRPCSDSVSVRCRR